MSVLFDLFYLSLAVLVLTIIAFIVRAVRLTRASIANASRDVNLTNPEVAASLVAQMRERNLPCPRCGDDTFAHLGTGNRYKCDSCGHQFEGPAHLPGSSVR